MLIEHSYIQAGLTASLRLLLVVVPQQQRREKAVFQLEATQCAAQNSFKTSVLRTTGCGLHVDFISILLIVSCEAQPHSHYNYDFTIRQVRTI